VSTWFESDDVYICNNEVIKYKYINMKLLSTGHFNTPVYD